MSKEAKGIDPPGTTPQAVGGVGLDTGGAVETGSCDRCQGNGEIVTDWDRYLSPHPGDAPDAAVADCPDCGGRGEDGKVRVSPVDGAARSPQPIREEPVSNPQTQTPGGIQNET